MFVCTQVLEPIGTECQLTILLDGSPPIEVRGVVRRVVEREDADDSIGLGVEFVAIGPTERAWIRAVVDRMMSDAQTRPVDGR